MNNESRFLDHEGRVQQWPSKHADKLLVLAYLAAKFDFAKVYAEREVNELLKQWHTFGDWPLLRRELCDYGFLERNLNGSNYKLSRLETSLPELFLVRPNIISDPPLSVEWINGPDGRETMRLMGNPDKNYQPTTLQLEEKRVRDFITAMDQRTWSLNLDGHTVGAIWIWTTPASSKRLKFPSVHFMIGEATARKRGVGLAALTAIIKLLEREGEYSELYSRHLLSNEGSAHLLRKVGFELDGTSYIDEDGLEFQNVKLGLHVK